LDLSEAGSNPCVLDVGCGAGQTLRRLEPDGPATLCGVDIDLTALAFGARAASLEGIHLSLACASGTSLPYSDKAFDLVITRVALNYMHQKAAIKEMARVLRSGGILFCRAERIWYDLYMITMRRGWKEIICGLRDLVWGTLHAVAGWQPTPGSTLRGGRAFVSVARLRRILAQYGCDRVTATPSPDGPMFAGRRNQLIVVARKR
jgi:SAM-dependent methyltransferase